MYKVMWLLKRKAGISHAQFREHYENSHAKLAHKYIGHLMLEYKRNYKTETWGGGVPIVYQHQTVGAVGVSGLPEEEDMVLAALGASLIG